MRGRGAVGVVGAIVVVGVVLAAMAVAEIGPWSKPATLVVGDSVTNLSRDEIEAKIGAKVDAQSGYTWAQMAPKVRGVLTVMRADGESPERVGVLLGYNDVLKDQQNLEATRTVLEEFSEVPCVVVLKLPKLFNRDEATYNDEVQAIVDELPNTHTDDGWAKVINADLARDQQQLLEADLVHPRNAEARRALADSYAEAFDRHC